MTIFETPKQSKSATEFLKKPIGNLRRLYLFLSFAWCFNLMVMKTTLLLNFLLILLILTGTACKKLQGDGRTVVEGQVTDRSTGNPVPFAKLVVRSQPGNLAAGFNTKEFEKEADAQGKFDFSFEADGDKNYALLGYVAQRYYSGSGDEDMLELAGARRNTDLKLKLKAYAWAKIKFINEPPLDTAWFYVTGTYFHPDEFGNNFFRINKLHKDTTVIRALEAGQTSQLFWQIQKGLIKTEYRKDYYFASLDTVLVEIKY